LRKFALSDKENFYLLALVDKQERAEASEEGVADKLAFLASSLVVNAAINAFVGYPTHATIFWRVFDTATANKYFELLGFVFCILLIALIKPNSRIRKWVYYPPLADKQMNERIRAREEVYRH
jgi:hypothetical protein